MKFIIYKILRHKSRYISLVLSLVIMHMLMMMVISGGIQMKKEIFPNVIFNTDRLFRISILTGRPFVSEETVMAEIQTIRAIPEIEKVCFGPGPELTEKVYLSNREFMPDSLKNAFFMPVGAGFERIFELEVISGKFFSERASGLNEVIITEQLARQLNLLGKPLPRVITLPGRYDSIVWKSNLCGIIKDLNYYDMRNVAQKAFPIIIKSSGPGSYILKVKKGTDIAELESKIQNTVQPFFSGKAYFFEMEALDEIIWKDWAQWKIQILTIGSIIPIVLLYTIMALFGLFLNDVMRKKAEFGIMRAIGFNRFQIFNLIMKEGVFLSGVTILLVFLLSVMIPGARKIISFDKPNYFIELWIMSSTIITGLVILSAIIPAIKITMINPVEALAEE